MTSEEIPHDSCLAYIVTHNQATSPSFAHVVNRDQLDLLGVPLEPPFERQGVMVKAQDGGALTVEEQRGCRRAWLKVRLDYWCCWFRRRRY